MDNMDTMDTVDSMDSTHTHNGACCCVNVCFYSLVAPALPAARQYDTLMTH